MILHIPKNWSIWDVIRNMEVHRPRKTLRSVWVASDLVERGQAILLCASCRHGFDHKHHHYSNVSKDEMMYAGGDCDACGETGDNLFLFMPEQNVAACFVTKEERQREFKRIHGG